MNDFEKNRPQPGEHVTYETARIALTDRGHVVRTEGDICYCRLPQSTNETSFIWRHPDGLNTLHDWPSKHIA